MKPYLLVVGLLLICLLIGSVRGVEPITFTDLGNGTAMVCVNDEAFTSSSAAAVYDTGDGGNLGLGVVGCVGIVGLMGLSLRKKD